MLFGPRFFLPKKYQKISFNFYKTKDELLEISENISNNECVICLLPIFNESDEISQNNDKKEKEVEIYNSENIDTSRNEIYKNKEKNLNLNENVLKQKKLNIKNINRNKSRKKYCCKIIFCFKDILEVLLIKGFYKFYRIPKNPKNKEFMRTPCKHVFHTACLEKWFSMKKECPNCRCDLADKIF